LPNREEFLEGVERQNELKSLSGIAVANVGLGVVVLGGGKPALLI
jgi:hypothetical protein